MSLHVLGVRHHGPGSARSVVAALDAIAPDTVLIEGPADGDALVRFVGEGLEPPVALLAYAADAPGQATFWPFAVFSPEWQAISWARRNGVPVRFCDLPAAQVLAPRKGSAKAGAVAEQSGQDVASADPVEDLLDVEVEPEPDAATVALRTDPIAVLAHAAGHDDPERWWDDLVEHRGAGTPGGHADPLAAFEALTEAMAAVREGTPYDHVEARREAHMRQAIRAARTAGAQRIAVVCGAWHAPALVDPLPPAAKDARLLRGAARRKVSLTWVPYTHSRLAFASGYGAGVVSPGWYHHLFTAPDHAVTRWFTAVARTLREEDLPVSSAHVIEAVRLADTLAALRGRPHPGLSEVTDATRSVLCDGDEVLLDLVTRRLVVGEAIGTVPDDAPTVPLAADVLATARRLRVRQEASARTLDLDLRQATDLERSRLFHRLTALDVPWAVPATSDVRGRGTFRETWSLRWRPELSVALVEASVHGTTAAAAATARLEHDAATASSLGAVSLALEAALLADLPDALPAILRALDERAAADVDVLHLMAALPTLVRALRYGDVRGTDTSALAAVVDALTVRICAGLPAAAGGLDDGAAAQVRGFVDGVHAALALRQDGAHGAAQRGRWLDVLAGLAAREDVHGLLAGRVARLLRDDGRLAPREAGVLLHAALSRGVTPADKAAWVEGFLSDGGLLLAHDHDLLALIDAWVVGLGPDEFTDVLPLLRRTFSTFDRGARRQLAEQVRRTDPSGAGPHGAGRATGGTGPTGPTGAEALDDERARPAVLLAARLLGVTT